MEAEKYLDNMCTKHRNEMSDSMFKWIQTVKDDDKCGGPICFSINLYLQAKKAKDILEFGLRKGYSTKTLLFGCRDGVQGHLTNIDWWKSGFNQVTVDEIEGMELGKYLTCMKEDILNVPDEWFESHKFDLIFIDSGDDVNAVMDMARKATLSMREESVLLIHNILWNRVHKDAYLSYIQNTNDYGYEEVLVKYGLGILTKKRKQE